MIILGEGRILEEHCIFDGRYLCGILSGWRSLVFFFWGGGGGGVGEPLQGAPGCWGFWAEFGQCIRLGKAAWKGQPYQWELASEGGILFMNFLSYFHDVDKF
jgi:hypothetical protein